MGLGAMKRAKQPAEWQGAIESLTRAKDANQPLAVDLRQRIYLNAMIIDR
jgi:hypothetical protein